MIRLILVFLFIFMVVTFSINTFRTATNKDRWEFTKTAFYGIMVSTITIVVMSLIVILF